MSKKSWAITALPTIVGVGFTLFSFVTGHVVDESQAKLLDYLLVLGLGSGVTGAANAGFKRYQQFKK